MTRRQESLRTKDKEAATRLFHAKNEAHQQPALNLQIARAYLKASDPAIMSRTWQHALDAILQTKAGETRRRWVIAAKDQALDLIRHVIILETQAEHFLKTLQRSTVSTNIFIRRLHNFALDLNWLPWSVLPRKQWPAIRFKEKRAIRFEEHQRILGGEKSSEWRAYYELLWHLGGSQSDIASLQAEDIDWSSQTLAYSRMKTKSPALVHFGDTVAGILSTLPKQGPLFPMLVNWPETDRAKAFIRRCRRVAVSGVSLHSYRYAWAERAKTCGYPERFAQQALGHNSKAVHRAYAKNAPVKVPSLEDYERKFEANKVLRVEFKSQRRVADHAE